MEEPIEQNSISTGAGIIKKRGGGEIKKHGGVMLNPDAPPPPQEKEGRSSRRNVLATKSLTANRRQGQASGGRRFSRR